MTVLDVGGEATLTDISLEAFKPKPEDTSNYQVAFGISAVLLGLASAGHLLAFCVRKTQMGRRTLRN